MNPPVRAPAAAVHSVAVLNNHNTSTKCISSRAGNNRRCTSRPSGRAPQPRHAHSYWPSHIVIN